MAQTSGRPRPRPIPYISITPKETGNRSKVTPKTTQETVLNFKPNNAIVEGPSAASRHAPPRHALRAEAASVSAPPAQKRRKVNDGEYYEAVDIVLQQALEDKKKAVDALTRLQEEMKRKDAQLKAMQADLEVVEKDKQDVAKKLVLKTVECNRWQHENITMKRQGESHASQADKAKEILEKFSVEMGHALDPAGRK